MWAQGRPGEKDKALSIALHFPSTLFLNHPGLNVLFCPIGSLPFQYIHREPSLNKHLPATCSFALAELPSSIYVNSKGLHYRVCSRRMRESLSLLMVSPLSTPHWRQPSVINSFPLPPSWSNHRFKGYANFFFQSFCDMPPFPYPDREIDAYPSLTITKDHMPWTSLHANASTAYAINS